MKKKGYVEDKEISIEEFCNNFIFIEPKDSTHPAGLYKLNFEGNKCTTLSYQKTGQ